MSLERVQKILARAGIASRRKAEELITEGLVTINGKPAKLGDKAEFGKDAIKVRGKLLLKSESLVYIAFHKPRGVISTLSDPEGRPTIKDYLDSVRERVFPVGRMDFNSEGLLLLTNDGDFSENLQKREDIPRVYHVKIKTPENPAEAIKRLEKGAKIGRKFIKAHSVRFVEEFTTKSLVEVVILGSGATDLKAMFEAKGFLTERIIRKAIGHITLKGMAPGDVKRLKPSTATALLEQPELGMRDIEAAAAKRTVIITPRAERITPNSERITSKAARITPKAARISPKAERITPKSGRGAHGPKRTGSRRAIITPVRSRSTSRPG